MIYLALWSGGYEMPSLSRPYAAQEKASQEAHSYLPDAEDSDSILVVEIDTEHMVSKVVEVLR